MSKPKVIKDYEKLLPEVIEQIKLVYPRGFTKHLITYSNQKGELNKGLPFETEEYYYLIRMNEAKAASIIQEDNDYDIDGNLKEKVKSRYEEKHEDEDFLNELNGNSDNELG